MSSPKRATSIPSTSGSWLASTGLCIAALTKSPLMNLLKALPREQSLDATVHEVAVLAVGRDPALEFLFVGDRDGSAIDVPGDPMTVVEAILELPFRVEGFPKTHQMTSASRSV